MSADDERITALEIKLSYLEDFMNGLQQASLEQAKLIGDLQREQKLLVGRVRELSAQLEDDIADRKPPHY